MHYYYKNKKILVTLPVQKKMSIYFGIELGLRNDGRFPFGQIPKIPVPG